jgi:glycine/D-amino acid oxidase-like deaminating enzyme
LALRVHAGDDADAGWRSIFTSGARLAPDPESAAVSDRLGSRYPVWRADGAQRADARRLTEIINRRLHGRLTSYTGIKVDGIVEKQAAVHVYTLDGLVFAADQVILAPGPWALAAEFRPFTQDLGIRIKRVVAFHLDASAEDERTEPAVDLFVAEDAFLMPRAGGGGRLFSFTRQRWDVSPEESGAGIGAEDRDEAVRILRDVAPRLVDAIIGGQAFCDAYSPTRVPIVAEVGRTGRIVFAGAANGSGYRLAPAIADGVLGFVAARQARETV